MSDNTGKTKDDHLCSTNIAYVGDPIHINNQIIKKKKKEIIKD